MKAGDTVRVQIDTNGGHHPLVGEKGYYADTVRVVGKRGDIEFATLTHVSWVPLHDCTLTTNLNAKVTVKGKTYTIRMMDRGKVWWAKLPRGLEPLACEESYTLALRNAVTRLYYAN